MHLAALVDSPNHVCCRYRLAAFTPIFEAAGHRLTLHPFETGFFSRFFFDSTIQNADAVIIQRKLVSWLELRQLRRVARRLILDVDDAVWLRDSYAPKGLHSKKRLNRWQRMLRNIDHIVTGNSFLASQANTQQLGLSSTVIPTCVDVHRYPLADQKRNPPNLVWIGSSSTLKGLEAIRPILEAVGKAVPEARLHLICDRFLDLNNLQTIKTPWTEHEETTHLANSAIGISWIPDDDWSRGKCGLKVLQYMAAGLPVIANSVGVHPEMIEHGVNGFLADTQEQWCEAVTTLIRNPDRRAKMGIAARKVVESRYTVQVGGAKWLSLLETMQLRRAG